MKKFIILFLVVISIYSCCNKISKSNFEKDGFMLSYRKTACFGACPVFELTIMGNGNSIYKGIANVSKLGEFQYKFSDKEINQLFEQISKAEFYNLHDKYTDFITDLPTTFIKIVSNIGVKEIEDYYGAPKKLKQFESFLDNLIDKTNWEQKTN